MSSELTLSRPYAKALFDLACEQNEIEQWHERLAFLSDLASNEEIALLIESPDISREQKADLMLALYGKKDSNSNSMNLIKLLAENDRLTILPAIYESFDLLKNEHDNTVEAELITASKVNKTYIEKVTKTLSERLGKKVIVNTSVDKDILGGAVIRAGDLVIDGSIKGKLAKLANTLIH